MTYHNTTNSVEPDLFRFQQKASNQDEVILEWFKHAFPGAGTPSQVQACVLPDAPITSIRRAITNLTKRGFLVKTGVQVKGPYGRPEYVWKTAS